MAFSMPRQMLIPRHLNWIQSHSYGTTLQPPWPVKQGNFQKALDSYQQALDLADSVNRQYLASIRLGETYKTLNNLDMAEDAYRVALDLGTGGAAVHARLGELYLVTEDYEQSIELLSRALSHQPWTPASCTILLPWPTVGWASGILPCSICHDAAKCAASREIRCLDTWTAC